MLSEMSSSSDTKNGIDEAMNVRLAVLVGAVAVSVTRGIVMVKDGKS